MKKVIASAGLVALGAAATQTALCQLVETDKPWTLSATMRGFYDDNYDTQPSGPGRRSSFGFEGRPSAAVNWENGGTTLTASYTLDARYYTDRINNDTDWSHDFEAFFNHNFSSRMSLDIRDSFVVAQEPEVLDPSSPAGEPLRLNGNNIRNMGAINFHDQLTPLLGIVAGFKNTMYDYQDTSDTTSGTGAGLESTKTSLATLLNRLESTWTLDTRWTILPTTVGVIGYQFEWVDYTRNQPINLGFPGPHGPIMSDNRDDYSHYAYVGVDHSFRSDLRGSVRVGGEYVDYYKALAPNTDHSLSPYADVSLDWTYTEAGDLVVGFRHSHNQTDQAGTASVNGSYTFDQESSAVYASVVQRLTPISPNLTATVTGQYQNAAYHGGALEGESDNLYLVGLNLTYQFNRYFSADLGYNYDKLDSDIAGRPYDRNRVYIGVTGSY
jgi:hypothetical protein